MRGSYTVSEFIHDVLLFILSQHITDLVFLFTGYIGEFEEVDDHRNGKIVVQLNGRYVFF